MNLGKTKNKKIRSSTSKVSHRNGLSHFILIANNQINQSIKPGYEVHLFFLEAGDLSNVLLISMHV